MTRPPSAKHPSSGKKRSGWLDRIPRFSGANIIALVAVLVAVFQSTLSFLARNDQEKSQLFASRVSACSKAIFFSRKFAVRVGAKHSEWIAQANAGQGVALDEPAYTSMEDLMGELMTLTLLGPKKIEYAARTLQGRALDLIGTGTGEVSSEGEFEKREIAYRAAEEALTSECHARLTSSESTP